MTVPMPISAEPEGPAGYSYAAVLIGLPAGTREELLGALGGLRFSGWVAPADDGWVSVIPADTGTVAAGRRGVVEVGSALAGTFAAPVVAFRVLHDRQLVLAAWESGQEVARYVSDPSREPGAEHDVASDPYGADGAEAFAITCGRPEVAEELGELLGEPLDPEEEIESERLSAVLRLLGLPAWLVTTWRLPRELPTGPASRALIRLRAGRTGPRGFLLGPVARPGRRWRPPPPVLRAPPRDEGGDDIAMWL